jgi:hypothetical protein
MGSRGLVAAPRFRAAPQAEVGEGCGVDRAAAAGQGLGAERHRHEVIARVGGGVAPRGLGAEAKRPW